MDGIKSVVLIGFLLLTACGGGSLDNRIDPNTRYLFGHIVGKKDIGRKKLQQRLEAAESRDQANMVSTFGVVGLFFIGSGVSSPFDITVQGSSWEYYIEVGSDERYLVISKYPGFSMGDCIKLYISDNPEQYPPRMAYGYHCG